MYERACAAHEITISQMKEITEIFRSEIKEIRSTNGYMQNYMDSCHKVPERRASYLEYSTAHFENITNIDVHGDSVITQEKKMGVRNIVRQILTSKMRQTRVLNKTQAKN